MRRMTSGTLLLLIAAALSVAVGSPPPESESWHVVPASTGNPSPYVLLQSSAIDRAMTWPRVDWTEASVLEELRKPGRENNPIEGIWEYQGGRFRIAVLRDPDSPGWFRAAVLSTNVSMWAPGMVKFKLVEIGDATGRFSTVYYLNNFSREIRVSTLSGRRLVIPRLASEILRGYDVVLEKVAPEAARTGTARPDQLPGVVGVPELEPAPAPEPPGAPSVAATPTPTPTPTPAPAPQPQPEIIEVTGSGFLISEAGLVVTNSHVIEGTEWIRVNLAEGSASFLAKVVLNDAANDLAILQLQDFVFGDVFSQGIPFGIGDSSQTQLGESVLALGFPLSSLLGSGLRVTDGIISAKSGIRGAPNVFQISNPLQPGNSGGPLFNMRGELVGIVVASLDASFVLGVAGALPQNVNFAVKSAYLENLVRMLPVGSDALGHEPSEELLASNRLVSAVAPFIAFIEAR